MSATYKQKLGAQMGVIEQKAPYRLVATMTQGHEIVIESGWNPSEIERAISRVSLNPKTVKRVEFESVYENSRRALWDAQWDHDSGIIWDPKNGWAIRND